MANQAGDEAEHEAVLSGLRAIRKAGMANVTDFQSGFLAALGLPSDTPTAQLKPRVHRELMSCLHHLDEQLRVSFMTAAGFSSGAPKGAEARIEAAANDLGISSRTVRRYVDKAEQAIANLLMARRHNPDLQEKDWLITRVVCNVDLRRDEPWLTMERTISPQSRTVATFDDRLSFPLLAERDLKYWALEGCQLERLVNEGGGAWQAYLRLSRPIPFGTQHTFVVSVGLPAHDAMEPVIGFFPFSETQNMKLTIRFGERRPSSIEVFEKAIPVGRFASPPTRSLDPTLAVHSEIFEELTPGFTYGIRWQW